jgi:hypothetical protein
MRPATSCRAPDQSGSLDAVDLLIERGLDVNYRERGDNTYALTWLAAQGNLAMVCKLVQAIHWFHASYRIRLRPSGFGGTGQTISKGPASYA